MGIGAWRTVSITIKTEEEVAREKEKIERERERYIKHASISKPCKQDSVSSTNDHIVNSLIKRDRVKGDVGEGADDILSTYNPYGMSDVYKGVMLTNVSDNMKDDDDGNTMGEVVFKKRKRHNK